MFVAGVDWWFDCLTDSLGICWEGQVAFELGFVSWCVKFCNGWAYEEVQAVESRESKSLDWEIT